MPQIQGKQLVDSAITTAKIAAGALSADAAGRAKMATGLFDAATASDKFAANAIALSLLAEAVLQADGGQAWTGNQAAGGFTLTGLGAPTADGDAARKSYVDATAQGLAVKPSARLATAAALPAVTYANGAAGVGATLTATAVGVLTVDGSTVALNNIVIVKNQASALQNGHYKCTTEGTGAVAFVLTRSVQMDEASDVPGAFAFVQEGTANADKGFVCTANAPVTMGTTEIDWTQFSGAGQITAGAGLTKTGDTLDVVAAAGGGITVAADSIAVDYGLVGAITTVQAADSAAAGTAATAARGDHRHAVSTAAAGDAKALADSGALGTAARLARADHAHARDIEKQEVVTTQTITGTDTPLTDTLDSVPINAASVQLFLNGVFQEQGAGKDYTLGGAGNQTITWLAATGIAVDMLGGAGNDVLTAHYISAGAAV